MNVLTRRSSWMKCSLATLVAAFVIADASLLQTTSAQQLPPSLAKCTGKQRDPNGRCSKDASCDGAETCSSWVETFATPLCNGSTPVAADNCVVHPTELKLCATRGTCYLNSNGVCVKGTGQWPVQTGTVSDGGPCIVNP